MAQSPAGMGFHSFFNIVDGKPRGSAKTACGIDPSTESSLWEVPVATARDREDAVRAANDAFKSWSSTPIQERTRLISLFKCSYESHVDSFTELLMAECGKPRALAAGEAHEVLTHFDHNLQLQIPEETIEDEERIITTRHVPVGVITAICPWNFPLILSMGKVLPALLAGCCIIIKPSPFTPYTALKVAELAQATFPPGVVQALAGDDSLGPALVEHPGVHKISFTGSIGTGKKIMASSAETLKRLTLELGGNDPAIVLPDVNIEEAAPKVVQGVFAFSGQVCVATKRVYVHADIYKPFLKAMVDAAAELRVGNAKDTDTSMGPIQNRMQYERVKELVNDSMGKGHEFALRPQKIVDGPGYFIGPSILDNPPCDARAVVEEQFGRSHPQVFAKVTTNNGGSLTGPIVPVLKWADETEVIACANDTNVGLAASVWSSNVVNAEKIGRQIQAGSVFINSSAKVTPRALFSGQKESGLGGEWGTAGILEYCNAQVTHVFK